MKVLRKLLVVLVVVIAALTVAAYVCVEYLSKDFLSQKLSESFDRRVDITDVSYHFPRGIRLDGMRVEDLFDVQRMYVYPNWRTLLESIVEIRQVEMIGFKISLDRDWSSSKAKVEGDDDSSAQRDSMNKSILIKEVRIRSGKVDGLAANHNLFKGSTLSNIRADIRDVYLPIRSTKVDYRMEAMLQMPNTPFASSRLDMKGWINVIRRDMEGLLNVFNQQGVNQVSAEINSTDNNVIVHGFISHQGELGKQLGATPVESVGELLFRSMADTNVHVGTNFTFETKLDTFRIGRVVFEGVVEEVE